MSTPGSSDSHAIADSNTLGVPYPSERYAWYVVIILMIVYVFSFVDRQILSLLVDPIKTDLELSDTQISYLGGFTFALFYTFFGIPIARWADSKNRTTLITVGLAVWSFFTMLCGTASRFWAFAFYRMGVGVGEATLSPSAYSIISDMFRPERLAVAISLYSAGIYIGSGLAQVFGGIIIGFAVSATELTVPFVGPVAPWQYVFFAVGFPGLIFTLALLTVREPMRRNRSRLDPSKVIQPPPISEVLAYIRANSKTFLFHNLGIAFTSFVSYGAAYWVPSYLIRVHGLTAQETGIYYGWVVVIFGTAGIVLGGYLADVLTQRGKAAAKMQVAMLGALLGVPFSVLYPLMSTPTAALLALCPAAFAAAMPLGVAAAAIQQIMPANMRAQGSALYLFVINLIGLGLGPSAVAWCTDYIFKDPDKVNLSLLWVGTSFGLVSALLLYFGSKHYRATLAYLENYNKKHLI
ncbi:MAG TPA: MFS transporter [Gammaproteobacteria bacterium]|nr:MFS transporter [Gammaproteobacteria bacterium]